MTAFDVAQLPARIDGILSRWPAVGLAVGVVRAGEPEPTIVTRGLADLATGRPVTPDTAFRIASITKTFTAIAVLQLWESGAVDLDAPANDHLRSFRLRPTQASWRAATVRHLLTHTAGIPKLVHPVQALSSGWFGESVGIDEPLPTLASFYGGELRLVAEPGTTFNYSDHSLAAAGQLVEDVSGLPLAGYLRQHVFEPLGMADTDLERTERITAALATGYRLRSRGPVAVTDRLWVTSAASSISSTPRDMARYLGALLHGGAGEQGTILRPATVAAMFAAQHQPDPRIPGMGLGFAREDLAGHPAVEHQGILPGFNAQVELAPEDGIAVVGLTNGARNAVTWLTAEMSRLLRDLVGADADTVRTDVPHHPELWHQLCGWYRPIAQRSDTQALALLGAGVEVRARRGQLVVRALSPMPALARGFVLHPDDPDDPEVFRVDLSAYGLGTAKVVFSREAGTTRLHLDVVPLSAEKRRPGSSRRVLAA